jgi:hypothetical protein
MGRTVRAMVLGAAALWVCACSVAEEPAVRQAALSTAASDNLCNPSVLDALESEATALANPTGCTDVSECRTAPVGALACGGPRYHVVYCSLTTDEDALLRSLDRLARREERFNRQCDIVSICIFREPPQLTLVDGVCQTATTTF